MEVIKTSIKDLVILKPKVFSDERGYFMESFKSDFFQKHVSRVEFVQENESKSSFGVLRGLHFQIPPYSQAKLVRVIKGEVLDVAVDLRSKSSTYGKYESVILSGSNKKQFYIPRGFAHGFIVLSKTAIFSYKVDNIYSPNHESGIMFNDKYLDIDWIIDSKSMLLSEKDKNLEEFREFKSPFNESTSIR